MNGKEQADKRLYVCTYYGKVQVQHSFKPKRGDHGNPGKNNYHSTYAFVMTRGRMMRKVRSNRTRHTLRHKSINSLKGVYVVARIVFLLLLNCSAWSCLGPA